MKWIKIILTVVVGAIVSIFPVITEWIISLLIPIKQHLMSLPSVLITIIFSVFSSIITLFLLTLLECIPMKMHFNRSLEVLKIIRKEMKRRALLPKKKSENTRINSIIQSPLEYAKEIVTGNQVPSFKPDNSHQDKIFESDVRYIIAITAENPNLWMDPTVCFYMANCYAVSIVNQINKVLKKTDERIIKVVVNNRDDKLIEKINKERKEIIDNLGKNTIGGFEFIRIFMFTEDQNKSCENAVFPSLKASQDLFRTHSFYINKDMMKTRQEIDWDSFSDAVKRLWSIFDKTTINDDGKAKEILKTRKKEIIPEFLLLYYDNKIELLSYLGGVPVREPIMPDKKYREVIADDKCNYLDKRINEDIIEMLSWLKLYIKKRECKNDLNFENNTEMVNNNNAFIDWEMVPIPETHTPEQNSNPRNNNKVKHH